MDWINCNSCFQQPCESANTKFSLTSCGHIFCENCNCFVAGTLDCCRVCKTKCSSVIIGDKRFQTNPQILEYFQDLEKECETMVQVMRFQKAHRIKLFEHHQSIVSKYNKAKLYIKKLEKELMVTKNALRNTSRKFQNPRSVAAENHSLMTSMPSFHSNSTSYRMMDAESKFQPIQNIKHTMPDMRHRKQSFQNELSSLSAESNVSESHVPASSVYSSPYQQNYENNYMPAMNNLRLNSFGNRQFRRE